jgi:LytR cell envelope-related transcriptional attenuator/tetratricopeptide repeat protein
MKTGKERYLLVAVCLFLIVGCATTSNTGHVFAPTVVEPSCRYTLNRGEVQLFSESVRPINGEIAAKYDLARHCQRIRKHRIAIETLKEIIRMDSTHAHAHNAMGFSYDCLGDYKTGQYHYRMAIALASEMDQAYNNLGYSYILDGNFTAAIMVIEQAIALNDTNPRYQRNLGLAYFKNNNMEKAALAFERAGGGIKNGNLLARLGGQTTNKQAADVYREQAASSINISQGKFDKAQRWQPAVNDPAAASAPETQHIEKTSAGTAPVVQSLQLFSGDRPLSIGAVSTNHLPVVDLDPEMRIEVSNGNGVRRMARRVADYLKEKGLNDFRLTNADHFGYEQTAIYYRNGFYDQALGIKKLLSGFLNVGQLIEIELKRDPIRLLIGRDLASFKPHFRIGVKVDVSNGNGINGMAKRLGEYLTREGFRVGRLTNADHFRYARTVVYFSKGWSEQAKIVADALPAKNRSPLVELNNNGNRIQVCIGSDLIF